MSEAAVKVVTDVSPPINVIATAVSSIHANISWDPPNDTPNCVTGYYIEYNGQLFYTTGTSITVPVTNNTLNIYTVKATNGLMRNSTARSVTLNARGPSIVIEPLTYTYNDPDNTTDTLLVISWNFTLPVRSLVNITGLLVNLNNKEIPDNGINTMMLSTLVPENMTYTVTLVAYNCFGSSASPAESIFIPPSFNGTIIITTVIPTSIVILQNDTDDTGYIVGISVTSVTAAGASGVTLTLIIAIVVIIKKNNNRKENRIELDEVKKPDEINKL
jgi:hypothetical protein